MRFGVWRTGHEIADRVAEAVWRGVANSLGFTNILAITGGHIPSLHSDGSHTLSYQNANDEKRQNWERISKVVRSHDIHIGYGILRGMDDVFRACQKAGKPFVHIDKGYFLPGHFDGYYRVSLNGTQQTFGLDKLEPDYARWEKLGIGIVDRPYHDSNCEVMMCPPTDYVANFFGVDSKEWAEAVRPKTGTWFFRQKGCDRSLDKDFDECQEVRTFNSSVAWEALRQGIPVVSDATHSIVGSFQKILDKDISKDLDERRRLFALMSSLQCTLTEMREGKLWQIVNRLLSI